VFTQSSSSSSFPSSTLIEEKFLPPNSAQGIWIRIKGYTNHLSPIGRRYAREQFNLERVGNLADHYRETLLKDHNNHNNEGSGTGSSILKIEALRKLKVLAVVNTRLTKEEEEVFNNFKRQEQHQDSQLSIPPPVDDESGGAREQQYIQEGEEEISRFTTRSTSRYSPQSVNEFSQSSSRLPRLSMERLRERFRYSNDDADGMMEEEEDEDDDEDYSDLPPLVEADWVPPPSIQPNSSQSNMVVVETPVTLEEEEEGLSNNTAVWRIATTQELIEDNRRLNNGRDNIDRGR
jgi:hypothetical protein